MKKIIILMVLLMSYMNMVRAEVPTVAPEELQPGMRGYAKTVIKGVKIETFDVEILGVTGSQTLGHSILVKASGPLIEKSGGIAQGMSGSPVYINGRLAGAVAYGKAFSDPTYCFLTPIGEMLAMLDKPNPRPSVFLPKNTPLMVSGFTSDGLAYLQEKLQPQGLKVFDVPSGSGDMGEVQLEPGSSIGVALVRGDMSVGSIGTVTWKGDDGRILAFGHPFLQSGTADYFMTNAWIYASIPNMESAFKVGKLGSLVGKITQDRIPGIAGQDGQYPHIIPMFIATTDRETGKHKTASVQLVTDENLVPSLLDSVVYNTVSKTIARKGGGSAKVKFTIEAVGEKSGHMTLQRENMFVTPQDISRNVTGELVFINRLLLKNKFEKVTLMDVNADVEVTDEYAIADLEKTSLSNKYVRPGQKIPIKVTFKPFRAEEVTRTILYQVPQTQPKGKFDIVIRGGRANSWLRELVSKKQEEGTEVVYEKYKDLKKFVEDFNKVDSNNILVVDVVDKKQKAALKPEVKGKKQQTTITELQQGTKDKQIFPMDFVINGEITMSLEVK